MGNAALKVEKRELLGGGRVKRLRDKGFIPAVVYGKGMESFPAVIRLSDFRESLSKNGKNAVFDLTIQDGKPFPAIIKEIQYDAVKNSYLHVDLQQISLTEKRKASVPVRIVGSVPGGVTVQHMDEIEVECLPLDIPAFAEADVSGLEAGGHLTAGDLTLPDNVVLVTEPGVLIASINEPRSALGEEAANETGADGSEGEPAEDK